ncbi:peptidoglycan glycosyltransferase FtsI, partial [Erwinia amylovora]|nr:peptidoglycan glycosyltransferase FtsI [Erwinia amylovora]
ATLGSSGISRPLSITTGAPPVAGQRVVPDPLVRPVLPMLDSVALPGGGGGNAAMKGERLAITTGPATQVGPDGKVGNRSSAATA